MTTQANIAERLRTFDQEHLLRFWDELNEASRKSLAEQIAKIDFAQIARLYDERNQAEEVAAMADRAGEPAAIRLGDSAGRFSVTFAI